MTSRRILKVPGDAINRVDATFQQLATDYQRNRPAS
jgi:hypothetical protein